jgi:hypothetical protein
VKMGELYRVGYDAARAGPHWRTQPPGTEALGSTADER